MSPRYRPHVEGNSIGTPRVWRAPDTQCQRRAFSSRSAFPHDPPTCLPQKRCGYQRPGSFLCCALKLRLCSRDDSPSLNQYYFLICAALNLSVGKCFPRLFVRTAVLHGAVRLPLNFSHAVNDQKQLPLRSPCLSWKTMVVSPWCVLGGLFRWGTAPRSLSEPVV